MGRRIGLLGGTFDPPHVGHLWLAETAREQLQLDHILFMPVGIPPHKQGQPVTAVSHRLNMTHLAIADNAYFLLDTTDIERDPPHTSWGLIPLVRQNYPDAEFWFLIGTDSLADLPTWERPVELIRQCRLAVCPRPGVQVDWVALKTAVPDIETAVDSLNGPALAVSSTDIRRWRRAGHSIRYLVPRAVFNYINEHQLYPANHRDA